MKKIRIVIIDDHTLVRDGIRALLDNFEELEVVGEASDGITGIEAIRRLRPDVVLMDISMPRLNGMDAATCVLQEERLGARVLMLSMYANEEYVIRALRAGAAGYILKDSRKEELAHAILTVASGESYFSPQVSRAVIENYVHSVEAEPSPVERLTPRQREILKLIAQGRSSKEIANILNVSLKTVDTHRTQLMERLNIHDVSGLVRFAIKHALITLSD